MKPKLPKLRLNKLPLNLKSSKNSIAIFLVFLLAVNYLASQSSLYIDLTQDKIYTASDASKNILGNLKNPVKVTFYISKDLPADYVNYKTQIQDILSQYYDLCRGKLEVKYEEPDNGDSTVKNLSEKGIMQLQSQVVERDKVEMKNFFFGAEITSGEGDSVKKEVMAALPSLENFEYSFVSAVYSVSKEQKEVVAFLGGHGEKEIESSELKKSYEVDKVLISTEEGKKGFYLDDDSASSPQTSGTEESSKTPAEKKFINPTTVVIAGPQNKFTEQEIAILDDFITKGGKAVVLSEKINPDLQQGFVPKNVDTNISDFTKKYGIEIENNLAYDKLNVPITYPKQSYGMTMRFTSAYPFWIRAGKEGFGDSPALSKIQSVALLWASSLKTEDKEGYKVTSLISTSAAGETVSDSINISPEANLYFGNGGRKTLAAISTAKSGGGQVAVVGDSDFVSPGFVQPISDNEIFFMNLVDSISSSANLSSIRSKNISERPIKELAEGSKNYWKFISIAGGAILLCAYGFMRISKRKKLSRA